MPRTRPPAVPHGRPIEGDLPVAAVERALSILGAFRSGDALLSLGDLAERTGINKATILRLAATLQKHGYLNRTAVGDYRIGPAPLALATMFQRATQPAELVLPSLEQLVAQTGESASFHITLNDNERLCLYRVDSRHAVREHLRAGDVAPMDRGAAGRILTRVDSAMPNNSDDLAIVTAGEVTPDVRTIAAPVFDVAGRVAGAIAVSGPQFRFTTEACEGARPFLLTAARDVTLRMGGDRSIFDYPPKGSSV